MAITISGSSGITYPDGTTSNTGGNVTVTGALSLPSGNTAQRPASAANGAIRFNTSNNVVEVYNGIGWGGVGPLGVEYLVIAGGGAGGSGGFDGGGGAGGFLLGYFAPTKGTSYTVTVGAGGTLGANGSNSSIGTEVVAIGGGRGGEQSGGSGGGANYYNNVPGGLGVSGQGTNGGAGGGAPGYAGGGGGGAQLAGGNASNAYGGAGGRGMPSYITGTLTYYAGGGGGGTYPGYGDGYQGAGGLGGGGTGGASGAVAAVSGTVNTGGGGGGTATTGNGLGGSGIVVIRYAGQQVSTGGTVTSANGFTIHTFTSSGTYTA